MDSTRSVAPRPTVTPSDIRHLVLIGLMGVGKSTVGRRCAEMIGRPFVDTDAVIVDKAGMPLTEAFASVGEARLRDLEQAVVAETVASPEPLVIACGGCTVVRPDNGNLLRRTGFVVWLRAPTSVLVARVAGERGRPLLAADPASDLERLAAARADAYAAAADAVIDAGTGSVDDVAAAVLATFERDRREPRA